MKIQNISSAKLCLLANTVVILGVWIMVIKVLYLPNSMAGFIEAIESDFTNRFSLIFPTLLSPLILGVLSGISFVITFMNKKAWAFYLLPLIAVFILSGINFFLTESFSLILLTIPFLIWPFIVGIKRKE